MDQNYYHEPKKTGTARAVTTGLGTIGAAAGVGFLTHWEKSPFRLDKISEEACETGIKWFDNFVAKIDPSLRANKYVKYGILGATALGTILVSFGIGSAIDNSNYNRSVKKAQKRAIKLQQQSLSKMA